MMYISHSTKTKKILLENSVSNQDVIEQLIKELTYGDTDFKYEITFVDFRSIPASLFKTLYELRQRVKITVTQRSLWSYLSKLGIKNTYAGSEKSIKEAGAKKQIQAIAIGGSAGSLEKIISIIESLPYVDISVFVIIHISPQRESHLCEILQNVTKYRVYEAKHNMRIEKNAIYVAAPDNHLVVADGFIYLENQSKLNYARPSIDVTFKSLVYEYKEFLIGIIVCGYGSDGSTSLGELKEYNAEIIIENPKECEAKNMPMNAIKTNNYTKVLNLKQIVSYLKSIMSSHVDIEGEIDSFLENIFMIYGYDFRDYERGSLKRRIELIRGQSFIYDFKEFSRAVMNDEELFSKLLRALSINTSSFFRNPEVFQKIRHEVIPKLDNFPSIRVWCAGCSQGNEPYSVAMLLDEAGLLGKSQIYATDFNETVLNEAKNGIFQIKEFEEFKKNYGESGGKENAQKWFNTSDDFIEIKEEIMEKILFFKHNLVTDGSINEFNLIFCRNVLIYFNRNLQGRVFHTFDNSIDRDGFLILGESEVMPKEYKYRDIGSKIYTRNLHGN